MALIIYKFSYKVFFILFELPVKIKYFFQICELNSLESYKHLYNYFDILKMFNIFFGESGSGCPESKFSLRVKMLKFDYA